MENKERNLFREFIEELAKLDDIGADLDVKLVDEALAAWITQHYPKGFEFDYKRRDLTIAMVKKSAVILSLIKKSPYKTYIDAIIDMKWKKMCERFYRAKGSGRGGGKINEYYLLMRFALEIFSLGYALKSLEEKEKKKKDNDDAS